MAVVNAPILGSFQRPSDRHCDRKDHVWQEQPGRWKCCLCGAVVADRPPPAYPTPVLWLPDRFEWLTEPEKRLCPRKD